MITYDKPAFPTGSDVYGGMTLRDYFAAAVVSGMIVAAPSTNVSIIAKCAYALADAMLEAREVKP